MAIPTDRGHVILTEDAAGQTTVMVGTGLTDGAVQNVYAKHVGAAEVKVHPGVRLANGSHGRHSLDVVEVYVGGDDVVNIRRLEASGDLRAQA
ncbi:hypothetical protein [Plantactinospora soyae]|uniref:Uncharacterized protein n=1 Tax=Plantactinospora soyae TaxID=1544732 RepID=A0A927MDU9_9ACTN|nr:hypothetical protein [Plantactinospora soyae]MBE1492787.1 hypothetical protein [Plantactinospora soyae]